MRLGLKSDGDVLAPPLVFMIHHTSAQLLSRDVANVSSPERPYQQTSPTMHYDGLSGQPRPGKGRHAVSKPIFYTEYTGISSVREWQPGGQTGC
jgi:hypothetical protein